MKDLNKEYYKAFGLNLEKLIELHGKDVMTVASLGKIEPKQVYRALSGEHGINMKSILALAKGLEIHPKELFDFDFIFDAD